MHTKPPTIRDQQASVIRWNANHVVGCAVTVEMDSGEIQTTETRGPAYMLSGHTAVIQLRGISGCYLLARVRATAEVKPGV